MPSVARTRVVSSPFSTRSAQLLCGRHAAWGAPVIRPRHCVVKPLARQRLSCDNRAFANSGGGDGGGNGSSGGNTGGGGEGDDEGGFQSKQSILTALGIAVGFGGIMGYLKKGSKKSLMAGLGSAVAILICSSQLGGPYTQAALLGSIVVTGALALVMGKRAVDSKKFMPAGLVSTLSGVVCVALIVP